MTSLHVWCCSSKLGDVCRSFLCFLTTVFFIISNSLRKKPNERPAYTELMVSIEPEFLLRFSLCSRGRKEKKPFLISPPQQHPFFTLHDAKDTDVASFVKVILDD